MKRHLFLPFALLIFLFGLTALVSLPAANHPAEAKYAATPVVITVEVPVTVEVTRIVTVIVTPTFTPPPPTSTPLAAEDTVDDDAFQGPADAPIKMVEFSDFQCGYCARFALNTLQPLREHYGDLLQFVYRDFPIFGDPSIYAAMGAECAGDQGKFWDFHNLLFTNQAQEERLALTVDTLHLWAEQLELDVPEWETCLNADSTLQEVANDYIQGANWGVDGTPAFFINGEFVSGAQPLDVFIRIIDRKLIELGYAPPANE